MFFPPSHLWRFFTNQATLEVETQPVFFNTFDSLKKGQVHHNRVILYDTNPKNAQKLSEIPFSKDHIFALFDPLK